MKKLAIVLLAGFAVFAQGEMSDVERGQLTAALAEAGNSPLEVARALDNHLAKYPKSPGRFEIERAIVKSAIEAKDLKRVILYGEKVLGREPDDVLILEHAARALLSGDDKASAERALKHAQRLEQVLRGIEKKNAAAPVRWQLQLELEQALGRALVFQARASGNLGKHEEAAALGYKSYQQNPAAETAREAGRWLARLGRDEEAIDRYAEAFAIADPRLADADRVADLARMRELYRKGHGSETGLGDRVLAAYDRAAAALEARRARFRKVDPNAMLSDVMDFTLTGVRGDKLEMASLKGKVAILDFWATWCGPCRTQHPLYEQVKKRFAGRDDVVFLAIATDDNRDLVPPFLEKNKWSKAVYYEDGLSRLLTISSIPTTILLNKRGQVAGRMNGFIADRFVDMLTERIQQVLLE